MTNSSRQTRAGLLFVAPWLVGLLLLTIYPFLQSLYWSFCRYDLLNDPQWIGVENYRRLAAEIERGDEFGQALWNTVYYAALAVPGSVLLGVGLAVALNLRVRGQAVYRTLFFIPSIVPTVATSILWLWLLNPTRGLVNRLLAPTGWAPTWLNNAAEAFSPAQLWAGTAGLGSKDALALMTLWGVGNFMIIYLAALGNIPRELYEAAQLDGAGRVRQFTAVTLPHLTPVIFFNVVMGLVAAVQYFTQAYVVSGGSGGPEGSTRVLSLHIFLWGFKYLDAGYASAAAWVLFVLVAAVTLLLFRSARRWVHY
ncbi:carbohydrate ABC transporter permease [Symmachiella dynata]|uniref:Lactose transport system permease protein LacF n=1 Tax=Symmachiella dynata TaxID=2527995 RepID=A0A517ZJU6_9PLAN|nr:sugar ABC transporter permease [Symmachiella dynata]QDU42707.1 Lactose transport system permease protein LacF [Symmachiella dynata]